MPNFEPCKNCGAEITCGCSYQVATDGKSCCDSCIQAYELTLYKVKEELNNALIEPWGSLTAGLEQKNNEINNEQPIDELPSGADEASDDEQS